MAHIMSMRVRSRLLPINTHCYFTVLDIEFTSFPPVSVRATTSSLPQWRFTKNLEHKAPYKQTNKKGFLCISRKQVQGLQTNLDIIQKEVVKAKKFHELRHMCINRTPTKQVQAQVQIQDQEQDQLQALLGNHTIIAIKTNLDTILRPVYKTLITEKKGQKVPSLFSLSSVLSLIWRFTLISSNTFSAFATIPLPSTYATNLEISLEMFDLSRLRLDRDLDISLLGDVMQNERLEDIFLCGLDSGRYRVFEESYGDSEIPRQFRRCSTKEYYKYTGSKRHKKRERERMVAELLDIFSCLLLDIMCSMNHLGSQSMRLGI
ncbi:hypothetical protein J3Q64DRAFT_1703970 [Phycomyces blakesleeanus]|uniref:Uncharacterized protein n=2 Tax=Phycomyces blakesleeanus TaxID=4837 RepID=A0A163DHN9_PHYB8|nr:hypothetical protein PHYBLDRAFT_170661 [Phycomyces blakesleeanus NRRL 1555(-)]OAD71290.1 hypothetical protein PHYBLDRAFT_170661 [Phycomyces blakesleeanus NRRL 1555(-)]|eukprot:XP_018289330.1 hypothetical protein PHYBLDRAFT_170661 [Phycomyces blakesleeanus NRRL 1555(-)]